ncbi:MAG TPA: hypothetical protein VMJ64_11860, partial [Anaerolineales bacterium]|nr:hypothetical protein [Anaerolineales bacterium]
MNEHVSPELEARLHDLLAAPDADPAFVGRLRSQLIQRSPVKTTARTSPRVAWGLALALALLAIGLLAFSPQIARAMRRLLGYIPNVGYVEQGPALRVLSAPASIQKQGLALTLEQGVADSQRTVLLARIGGYTRTGAAAQTCTDMPRLESADGTVQKATSVNRSQDEQSGSDIFVRYEFQPMPAGTLDVTLKIPCLLFDPGYKDWSIPLKFQAAQGTGQVIPVIELPTALPTEPVATAASTSSAESAPAGFAVVLKSAAELADGYVLSGVYQWNDARIDKSAVVISHMSIVDANGQDVSFQEVGTDPAADAGPQQIPFAYQVTGKELAWPLKVIVYSISVVQPEQGTFQFDAGANPQPGQTWNVNIDVPVAGHVIRVETIGLSAGRTPTQLGFDFTMTSDPAVAGATVTDANPVIDCKSGCGGGGGGGGGGADVGVSGFDQATGPFYYGAAIEGYSPAGPKTFIISDMSVFFKGPWQASWQPS